MKRFASLCLVFCLFLSGCDILGERIKEPVTFYYLRSEYQDDMAEVILSEEREAAGHRNDLSYLLALYLMGPAQDDLVSPVPRSVKILSVDQTVAGIALKLSDTSKSMTDVEFTLACACLSLTCLDLTGAEKVNITSGSRSVTMTRDNLILFDSTAAAEETK